VSTTEDESVTVECSKHGTRMSAIVCQHHLDIRDPAVGFVENGSDPNDLQAWCGQCEQLFVEEGEMTPRFRSFNGMTVVCVVCYEELQRKHVHH